MINWPTALAAAAVLSSTAYAQEGPQPVQSDRYGVASTVSPEARKTLSFLYARIQKLQRGGKPKSVEDWDAQNAAFQVLKTRVAEAQVKQMHLAVVKDLIGGVPVLRIRREGWAPTGRTLVYLHGGGYTFYSAGTSIGVPGLVAVASGDEVVSVDYTLAPRGTWRIVTDQMLAVWRGLLANGGSAANLGLFGDSAGGGLAAGAVLKMRDQGLPLPGALYLMSPWADITVTGDTVATLAHADPILESDRLSWGADAYAPLAEQKNPYVSAVYGDYSKAYPPTLIQAGTHEIFLSHAVREYQAIRAGNHEAILDVYEGMPHVWQALDPTAPETRVAIDRAVAFLHAHLVAR